FEHGTLAAWVAFCRKPLDAIILEVGMGGRLDATNVFDADAAILTGVALDHQAYLGPDREAIGREKAGVFRPERPAIVADPVPPRSVLETAAALGAELYRLGVDFGYDGDRQQWRWWSRAAGNRGGLPYPALRGVNQLMNASAALMALTCLRDRLPLAMQAVREGLMTVELPGRFQVLPGRPSVILDVAHNPQAAAVLAENLAAMPGYRRTLAVVGMLADKDVEGVARILASRVDAWFAAGLHGPRALTAEALAARLESGGVATQGTFSSVTEALAAAQAQARDDDRIVVFGSFLAVADALRALHVQDTESR
ncbi:MAG: cyanophycin synthetase, partial [Tepidiphilus sp.]|nr:cyanophycin synthetase [Tepidiphilus sp.]MDD3432206.1 cyanophycin synthetase [Tepidiphilus sp.]